MARFEGALARASASAGLVPPACAEAIGQSCARARFDSAQLAKAARNAGTLAIPFVKELRTQVAASSPEAARYVHFGATSQDVIDTAVALCLKSASAPIMALTVRVGDALAQLARQHSRTATLARTMLQPALPVPFGWKAAVWLSLVARAHGAFRRSLGEACMLQLGGAGGTRSAFGTQGDAIAAAMARALDLELPALTWHSARDGFARFGAETAILAGAAAKIGRDISLLMQPEIGEAQEPSAPGRGGSSSMPHKRNPALSLLALEAAQRAPGLAATLLAQLAPEHERGLGQWQSQWFTLRELLLGASSALGAMAQALEGLEVNVEAMRSNLDRTGGLVFSEAVSSRLGRALADELCERARRENRPLLEVMRGDPQVGLADAELSALFDPQSGYGSAQAMIERALAQWQARQSSGKPT